MTEKTIEQHRKEFEDWLFLDQILFNADDLNKREKEISWEAWKSARGIKE